MSNEISNTAPVFGSMLPPLILKSKTVADELIPSSLTLIESVYP